MKCPFMKHRELVEFLTYLPWSLRNKLLKKVESKSDTLYVFLLINRSAVMYISMFLKYGNKKVSPI